MSDKTTYQDVDHADDGPLHLKGVSLPRHMGEESGQSFDQGPKAHWPYVLGAVLVALVAVLAVFADAATTWVLETWDGVSMNEIVFLLSSPMEGTSEEIIWEFVRAAVFPAVCVAVVVVVLAVWLRQSRARFFVVAGIVAFVCLVHAGVTISKAWESLKVETYYTGQSTYSTFIEDNYVEPADVALSFPEDKRNLIFIYLESMEITFADEGSGGGFEQNTIPELTSIALANEDFSGESGILNGAYVMPNCSWTMAGMFAQTSGLPLMISIGNNNMDTQDHFFSGVVSLGDILSAAGYSQYLMIGSDVTFGGRELYFSEHGNYTFYDYVYAQQTGLIAPDYKVWWGYEDAKLFEFAKDKITEAAEADSPFNFTILTVDTHRTDGYVCELCGDEFGDNQYANVMACSSRQVSAFVEWICDQDFFENTTIVLAGDHLTMDVDFCDDVDEDYDRRTYVAIINADATPATDASRTYTTFDMFPTTLAALGVGIEGERLGLGTNLYSAEQTLAELYGVEYMESELNKNSELMEELGALDEGDKDLLVRNGTLATIEMTGYQDGIVSLVATPSDELTDVVSATMAFWKESGQEDLLWLEMEVDRDGVCRLDVDMSLYGFEAGTYHAHFYVMDSTGEFFFAASDDVVVNNATVTCLDEGYGGIRTVLVACDPAVVEAESVRIAVWKKDDQSDIQWIETTPLGDDTFRCYIDLATFGNEGGTYNLHVYATPRWGEETFAGKALIKVETSTLADTLGL